MRHLQTNTQKNTHKLNAKKCTAFFAMHHKKASAAIIFQQQFFGGGLTHTKKAICLRKWPFKKKS